MQYDCEIGERTQQIEAVRSISKCESAVLVVRKPESGDVVEATCLRWYRKRVLSQGQVGEVVYSERSVNESTILSARCCYGRDCHKQSGRAM